MLRVSPEVKGLIFDCDGTLVDTMHLHWEAWEELFQEMGSEWPEEFKEFVDELCGVPTKGIVEKLNEKFHFGLDVETFSKRKEELATTKLGRARSIAPVIDLVKEHHGKLPMAVASGGVRVNVERALDAVALKDYFETIVTACDPVAPKPSPEIFLEAAKRMGIEPQYCQVFEDGEVGLKAARDAGMIATDVRPFI